MSTTHGPIRQFIGGTIRKLGGVPDEAVRVLRSLVEGLSKSVKLTIPVGCDVDDLKQLIKERAKPDLDGFVHSELILWKVYTLQRSNRHRN
jgi:hypothetical protein